MSTAVVTAVQGMIDLSYRLAASKPTNAAGDIYKLFLEEHGTDDAPDHKKNHRNVNGNRAFDSGCSACRTTADSNVLRQKYGLAAAELYEGPVRRLDGAVSFINERNLIQREGRRVVR